jgi:GDP/UDP-N,N'-diacetylbacillosamine 2-epimerase (hydrolysing)
MSKKLLIAVTNRSSYNKIKTIVRNLPDNVTPLFLLGGGVLLYRFGSIDTLIEKDFPYAEIYRVHLAVEGDDLGKMSKTVGVGIVEISTLLDIVRPDAVLVCADRYETLAVSISASYKNIPLIHLQGGEQTGTIDDKVRNANTVLADMHFPATVRSSMRLAHMITSEHIYPYGCPSMDLLLSNPDVWCVVQHDGRGDTDIMARLILDSTCVVNGKGKGDIIDCGEPYVIVMLHGDTTDKRFVSHMHQLTDALDMVDTQKIIFWNNIDPKGDQIAKMWREYDCMDLSRFIRHIEPEEFASVLLLSSCIVGNSSTGIREASFLGVPAVNIGDRQHGREHGENVVTVPFDKGAIYDAIMGRRGMVCKPSNLYGHGDAGERIAKRIGYELER